MVEKQHVRLVRLIPRGSVAKSRAYQIAEKVPTTLLLQEERQFLNRAK